MYPLFYKLQHTIKTFLSVKNVLIQIFACAITYIIVISGFDWTYFKFVHNSNLSVFLSPAVVIGGLVPMFGLPFIYFIAKITKHKNFLTTVWALIQSAILGSVISSTYKAFTGRVQPPRIILDNFANMSRDWNFGFLEHGIFWGWPSSHTTIAFAMSFTIISLYPKRKDVLWLAVIYAFYIGIGISMQIHWFSEFVAGAIIGTILGMIVGKNFRDKLKDK